MLGIQNETSYSVLLGYSALAATLGSATNATSFRDRRDYLTSYNVSVAVGDVNNDGIPDLVLCGGSGALVEFGNGDGTFTTGPEYLTGFVVYTPILADINGDGKLDLIMSFYSGVLPFSSGLAVGFGNGDGTFRSPVTYDAGTDPSAQTLVLGDFNHDQLPDAAILGEDGVWIFLGEGNGVFSRGVLVPVSSPLYGGFSLVTADFNEDGNLDLVAGTRSGFVLLLGKGNGTFQSPIANTTTSSAESIATADLNGDGKPDLIITSTSHANSALVLYGNGNGTFQRFKKVNLPNDYLIAIGDVNGDGKLDLVSNTGNVSYGESGGNFNPPFYFPDGYSSDDNQPTYIVLSNLRNAGYLDIAAANFYGAFSVLLNRGNGWHVHAG